MNRYISSFEIAWESILGNKVRAVLTGLGVSFGIASVISMLAIGRGAKVEIIEALNQIGENNIVIKGISDELGQNEKSTIKSKSYSNGLNLMDVEKLQNSIPEIDQLSPYVSLQTDAIFRSKKIKAELAGVSEPYFSLLNLTLKTGVGFSKEQENKGTAVCLLSSDLAKTLFKTENPIGKQLRCNKVYFTVIGVIKNQSSQSEVINNSDFAFNNNSIYIPIKAMLLRIKDRSKNSSSPPSMPYYFENSQANNRSKNNNQLDKVFIKVKNHEQIKSTSSLIYKTLYKAHNKVNDFKIIIPEEIIKQQEKTKNIFNLVLAVIAGISLLVGGIGIMNITYTSVLERTQEIGIRLAIGANKFDIGFQFLNEAILVSLSGGIIGIILGVLISKVITILTDINTIISFTSVVLSFLISVSTGLVFGYIPAKKASNKKPIDSLRHE